MLVRKLDQAASPPPTAGSGPATPASNDWLPGVKRMAQQALIAKADQPAAAEVRGAGMGGGARTGQQRRR